MTLRTRPGRSRHGRVPLPGRFVVVTVSAAGRATSWPARGAGRPHARPRSARGEGGPTRLRLRRRAISSSARRCGGWSTTTPRRRSGWRSPCRSRRTRPGTGFDRVYVLGVSRRDRPPASGRRLAELLDAHHYAPPGPRARPASGRRPTTPTRRHAGLRADGTTRRQLRHRAGGLTARRRARPTDGSRLARRARARPGGLRTSPARTAATSGRAAAMRAALWPATAGLSPSRSSSAPCSRWTPATGCSDFAREQRHRARAAAVASGRGPARTGCSRDRTAHAAGRRATRCDRAVRPVRARGRPAASSRSCCATCCWQMLRDWSASERSASPTPCDGSPGPRHVLDMLGLDASLDRQELALRRQRRPPRPPARLPPLPTARADAATTIVREGAFACSSASRAISGQPRAGSAAPDPARPGRARLRRRLRPAGDLARATRCATSTRPCRSAAGAATPSSSTLVRLAARAEPVRRGPGGVHDSSRTALLYLLLRQALLVQAARCRPADPRRRGHRQRGHSGSGRLRSNCSSLRAGRRRAPGEPLELPARPS